MNRPIPSQVKSYSLANPGVPQNKKRSNKLNQLNNSTTVTSTLPGRLETKKNFPGQLYLMLNDAEANGLSHIVSWQPHGRCFRVHKTPEFVKNVMPLYFRQTKWPSFQRQLHFYGFTRLAAKDSNDKGGYYHDYFLRGKPNLCEFISRTTLKGTKVRQPCDQEMEPNFYCMPPIDDNANTKSSGNNISSSSNPPLHLMPARKPVGTRKERLTRKEDFSFEAYLCNLGTTHTDRNMSTKQKSSVKVATNRRPKPSATNRPEIKISTKQESNDPYDNNVSKDCSSLLEEEFLCMPDNPQQLREFNKPLEKHNYLNELDDFNLPPPLHDDVDASRESLLKTITEARRTNIARSA